MNCDKCGKEMRSGYINCSRKGTICWVRDDRIFRPLWPDAEFLPLGGYLSGVPAFRCPQCKRIVIDYSEQEA